MNFTPVPLRDFDLQPPQLPVVGDQVLIAFALDEYIKREAVVTKIELDGFHCEPIYHKNIIIGKILFSDYRRYWVFA